MASTNSTTPAKTHVSLRLPTYLLESIDAHAERENISRTEAFVFYLQTGLDIADVKAEEPSKDESMLMSIQEDLAEIKALLQQGTTQAAPAQTIAGSAVPTNEASHALTAEEASESEAYAEENFAGSDAVFEETLANESEEESNEASSNNVYAAEEQTETEVVAEAEAEEDYAASAAVSEETFSTHITASEEVFVTHEADEEADDEPEAENKDENNEGDTSGLAEEENMFSTPDTIEEEPSNPVFSLYASGDSEEYTEIKPVESMSDFTTSDAVATEEVDSDDEDELAEEESLFSASDIEEDDSQEMNSFSSFATNDNIENDVEEEHIDENEDDEASSEDEAPEEAYDLDTSDAIDHEEIEDEVDPCNEALSYKKLEKAVAKASKQIDYIEKVWLFGPAANEEEISAPMLDLCVKTEDDKKLKSKHLDPYISAIEEKTGKIVNVVLRHEVEDKSELQNRIEIYKR